MHFAKKCHEQGSLASTGRADDQVDMSSLERKFLVDPKDEVTAAGARGPYTVVLARPCEGRLAESNDAGIGSRSVDGNVVFVSVLLRELIKKFGLVYMWLVPIDRGLGWMTLLTSCKKALTRSRETLARKQTRRK